MFKACRLILVLILCLMNFRLCHSKGYSPDEIDGLESAKAFMSKSALKLLCKNGFVVLPLYKHQMFSPYLDTSLPPFVTTDSLHRTFQVIFDDQVKFIEKSNAKKLTTLTERMLRPYQGKGNLPSHRLLAKKFFLVANGLIGGVTNNHFDDVLGEVRLINEAKFVRRSPLFGYLVDYSAFKPRGFYTESEELRCYFKAYHWFGTMVFRLNADIETLAALSISKDLQGDALARDLWNGFDELFTKLIGTADNPSPMDYGGLYKGLDLNNEGLTLFRQRAKKLPAPRYQSMVIEPLMQGKWQELSKGMSFLGKRYVPDGEVLQSVVHPKVSNRITPSGLDIMAANGSSIARELLSPSASHKEELDRAKSLFEKLKTTPKPSHYLQTLSLIETLTARPHKEALPFMKTRAYELKNLTTALAAWTSTRHCWQLQAKLNFQYNCISSYPSGRVEPNPAFFTRLLSLVSSTIELLMPIDGIETKRLQGYESLVKSLHEICRKQMIGESLTDEENRILQNYGPKSANLSGFLQNSYEVDEALPWMSHVADVYSEGQSEKCLVEAVGGAQPIYVLVPKEGSRWQLMQGSVYSHFEFLHPISERLTDSSWQGQCEGDRLPPIAPWGARYIAHYEEDEIISSLKKGIKDARLRGARSQRVLDTLLQECRPDGAFKGYDRRWALSEYGLMVGRERLSMLLSIVEHGQIPPVTENGTFDSGLASGATDALVKLVGPSDVDTLKGLALRVQEQAVRNFILILGTIRGEAAEIALCSLMGHLPKQAEYIAIILKEHGSENSVPSLLKAFEGNVKSRRAILDGIATIWTKDSYFEDWRYVCKKGQTFIEQQKMDTIVLARANIDNEDWSIRGNALKLLAFFKVKDIIDLVKRSCRRDLTTGAARILGNLASPDAVHTLLELALRKDFDGWDVMRVIDAMSKTKSQDVITQLVTFLDDKRETNVNSMLVCDCAAEALASFFPKGPQWPKNVKWEEREKTRKMYVLDWKAFMKKQQMIRN